MSENLDPFYYVNYTDNASFSLLTGKRVRLGVIVLELTGTPFLHEVAEKTWNGVPIMVKTMMVFAKYPEGTVRDQDEDRVFCVKYDVKYQFSTRRDAEYARQNFRIHYGSKYGPPRPE
jgi:hypothetical protein